MTVQILRGLAPLAAILALAGCAARAPLQPAAAAVPAGAPEVMLWVGNSFFYYNNSMHAHVAELVDSDKSILHRGVSLTISGAGIDWHDMASYLGPDRIGKYSFVPGDVIRANAPGKPFDAVMFMDCSQCPVHPQLKPVFHEFAKRHSDTIRASGARPILFMSWAYKEAPEMTARLAREYTIAGKANDVQVVPAGLAFARSVQRKPGLELYAPDGRHPSLAGTYLAACTVYASLFGKSPVGNAYTAGLPGDVAAHLQAAAWDAVKEYAAQ